MLLGCLALLELRSVSFEYLSVVGELPLSDVLPAVVAEPGFDTAATGEGHVGVVPMVTAVVGRILLQAAAVTVKGFVTAGSFAVAKLVAVLRVARGT